MSIFDHPDAVSAAPSWRCPGCRTLQPETTRCWRCGKPAWTCDTCHFYRPSLAMGLGSCAKDPSRTPLRADESHSCWEAAAVPPLLTPTATPEGFFPELDRPSERATQQAPRRAASEPAVPRVRPPLEEPGRAAWAERHGGALVEAPVVEPGRRLTTELQRRRSGQGDARPS